MDREATINKISSQIQYKINQLKKLNCSIDSYIGGIGVVDYNISTKDIDVNNDIIFTFDTVMYNKKCKP